MNVNWIASNQLEAKLDIDITLIMTRGLDFDNFLWYLQVIYSDLNLNNPFRLNCYPFESPLHIKPKLDFNSLKLVDIRIDIETLTALILPKL